jgi:hypothetical protein
MSSVPWKRNECSLLHLDAVVASVRVSDNLAWILACGETPLDKFIEAKLFRTTHFNGAILRCAQCDPASRINRCHRINPG